MTDALYWHVANLQWQVAITHIQSLADEDAVDQIFFRSTTGWTDGLLSRSVPLELFFQSEHVPLIKCYSTTRYRTLPPPVRRLGFQSHRRSPAPAAAALRCATCHLRGRRRLSSSACLLYSSYASRLAASALLYLPNAAFPSSTMMPSLSYKHSALARAPRISRLFVIMVLITPLAFCSHGSSCFFREGPFRSRF